MKHYLSPPAGDDEGNIEAEDEGEGDGGELVVAVADQQLECFSRLSPLKHCGLSNMVGHDLALPNVVSYSQTPHTLSGFGV